MKSYDGDPYRLDPAIQRADPRVHNHLMRPSVVRAISGALTVALTVSGTLVFLAQVRNRRATTIAMVPGSTQLSPSPSPTAEPTDALVPPPHPQGFPTSKPSEEPSRSPIVCHNSTDKRCGDFYWMKQPGSNAPLTVSIVVSTPDPTAGVPVTFIVTVSDADAPNTHVWSTPFWGDHTSPVVGFALCITPTYGGWTPPIKRSGTERFTFTHTYAESGNYTFTVGAQSDSGDPWHTRCIVADPYESVGHASKTVAVGAAPTESPSPTSTPSPTPTTP